MGGIGSAAHARDYDAIVVGSGFGGALSARALVDAGLRVLMLERGDWVARGAHCASPDRTLELGPHYDAARYRVVAGARNAAAGTTSCVGGGSVFYGGVSLRLRRGDFDPSPEIVDGSGAAWPLRYEDLEPWYDRAERALGVAGACGEDPTEPPRGGAYPARPAELSPISTRIGDAARALGFRPFRLPLAIDHEGSAGRRACTQCGTCDTFACAVGAKNDLATTILPALVRAGMSIAPRTRALRVVVARGRVTGVVCYDDREGGIRHYGAPRVVLAAGALATPHLLLASGLATQNPAGDVVGRYLMRHANAIVFGVFPFRPSDPPRFHKQLGVHDLYFGHPSVRSPLGKLGALQQLSTPPVALAAAHLPRLVRGAVPPVVRHMTGLLVMAEDQPRYENRVALDADAVDEAGMPRLAIEHRHTERDEAAVRALVGAAKPILARAGAIFFYVHPIETFSHALGTVRMGDDPRTAPLDRDGAFRGVEGLYVADASALPRSGAVNPSLTIAANAWRIGDCIARKG